MMSALTLVGAYVVATV